MQISTFSGYGLPGTRYTLKKYKTMRSILEWVLIIKIKKIHFSWEIEDFVETRLCKLCGSCTLLFTVLLWREDRLERPSPLAFRAPHPVNRERVRVRSQMGRLQGGGEKTVLLASDFIELQ